ncbi:MAG: MerC domain-containing protein [Saprospiraceae bacterium]|nr:MerC domain-containing protein [Saprospiraceae bacterium]
MTVFRDNRKLLEADSVGALASGLCMVHCLATPLLFFVQAGATCAEAGPWWWSIIDFLFLVVSGVAVWRSAKQDNKRWLNAALYLSWILLAGLLFNHRFHLISLPHILLYIPAIGLVGLHLYNMQTYRSVL